MKNAEVHLVPTASPAVVLPVVADSPAVAGGADSAVAMAAAAVGVADTVAISPISLIRPIRPIRLSPDALVRQ